MTKNDFIFSNQPTCRVARHLAFWGIYFIYFFLQSINPNEYKEVFQPATYWSAFLSLCCFVPACIFSVYISLYYLLPSFLQRKKYGMFVLSIFLLVLFDLAVNYFFAGIFLNNIHYQKPIPPNFLNTLGFSDGNTKWAVTIAIIAIGIKLAKNWHLQQKENLEIIKRKTRTELQIQKARINPAFLFHSLDTIYNKINAGAADSATMVLKLSDLLSYSLYESDTEAVLLDKELTGLRDFIFLEKTRQKNIDMKVSGDTYGKYIAPVLLPLMQECISLVEQEEKNNTGIIFHIISKTESLQVKIFFSFLNGGNTDSLKLGFITDTVRNKLKLINTKGDYHLVLEEPENEKRVTFNFPFTNCIVSEKNLPSQIQMVTHDPA